MKTAIASLLAVAVPLVMVADQAIAKPKHRAATPIDAVDAPGEIPLTVNRRSWLDPGPVAPRGTGQNYVTANTVLNRTPDQYIFPDQFGNSELPGAPYVPGRSQPVVQFSTTPTGRVEVANELLPQNFYFNPAPSRPAQDYRPSFSLDSDMPSDLR